MSRKRGVSAGSLTPSHLHAINENEEQESKMKESPKNLSSRHVKDFQRKEAQTTAMNSSDSTFMKFIEDTDYMPRTGLSVFSDKHITK